MTLFLPIEGVASGEAGALLYQFPAETRWTEHG
jgi:hypothetical protein